MKVIICTLQARMSHVSAEIWELGVYIYVGNNPSVNVTESKMMTEIVCPRLVTASRCEIRSLPYFIEC